MRILTELNDCYLRDSYEPVTILYYKHISTRAKSIESTIYTPIAKDSTLVKWAAVRTLRVGIALMNNQVAV